MDINTMNKTELLEFYEKKGIHFKNRIPVLVKDNDTFRQTVMDNDTYTYNPQSNGVLPWQLMINANKIVDQILLKRAYTKVSESFQQGGFATPIIQFTTRSFNGDMELYDDFSATQKSDINVTFPILDVVRLQTVIQYGDLEVEELSFAKIDAIASKENSAATIMSIAQNKLFFYGNLNTAGAFITKTFGLINNPQLNASIPITNGSGANPLWSDKAQRGASQDIVNDVVVTAFNALQIQVGGNVSKDDKLLLIVSSYQAGTLDSTNNFGLTPLAQIKKTLPNLEIEYVPEYQSAHVFQLIAVNVIGENVIKDLFTYKYRGHGIVRDLSAMKQKLSFGSGGCGLLAPLAVVTLSGAY